MDDRDFDVPDNATELAEEVRETERSLEAAALQQVRLMRLDQLRQTLAAFGLLVGTSKLPPPPALDDPRAGRVRVHDGSTTKDPEMASLLGLAVAMLDTIVGQGGAGIALAYEGLVREIAAAPSVAERELTWWRCMHNRAMLTYGLARLDPPTDLAPATEAVVAADTLVRAAARALHGATTIRLMLETAPDEMYGGAAARQDTMSKGMDIVRAGVESLDEVIAVLGARGDLLG